MSLRGFWRISSPLSPPFCLALSLHATLPQLPLPVNYRLLFLVTRTAMHFCFSQRASASSTSPSLSLALPPLPRCIWKGSVSLIRGPGKLALLSFLSTASSPVRLSGCALPNRAHSCAATDSDTKIHMSEYRFAPFLCVSVCLQVGFGLIGRSR